MKAKNRRPKAQIRKPTLPRRKPAVKKHIELAAIQGRAQEKWNNQTLGERIEVLRGIGATQRMLITEMAPRHWLQLSLWVRRALKAIAADEKAKEPKVAA